MLEEPNSQRWAPLPKSFVIPVVKKSIAVKVRVRLLRKARVTAGTSWTQQAATSFASAATVSFGTEEHMEPGLLPEAIITGCAQTGPDWYLRIVLSITGIYAFFSTMAFWNERIDHQQTYRLKEFFEEQVKASDGQKTHGTHPGS